MEVASKPEMTVLVNTRSTRCPADLESIRAPLEAAFRVEIKAVEDPRRFSREIESVAASTELIVIGSGDGTLARSAPALLASKRPIGVLPLGNANDLARGLGLPLELELACESLARSHAVPIDVGRVNGHYFFNAATVGIGAEISSGMNAETKRRWKRFSQVPRVVGAIRDRRPFGIVLKSAEATERFRSVHMTIANGRTIGGGILIDEDARLDDHRLDFSSVQPQRTFELLALAPAFLRGRRRRHPRVDHRSGRRFRVETSRRLDVATDGDVVTQTPAEFETLPHAIQVLVPRSPEPTIAMRT